METSTQGSELDSKRIDTELINELVSSLKILELKVKECVNKTTVYHQIKKCLFQVPTNFNEMKPTWP